MNKDKRIVAKALRDVLNLSEDTIADVVKCDNHNVARTLEWMDKGKVFFSVDDREIHTPVTFNDINKDEESKLLVYYLVTNQSKKGKLMTQTELAEKLHCSQSKISTLKKSVANKYDCPRITLNVK